jgi:DNA-binding transcriptional LysR family regulator
VPTGLQVRGRHTPAAARVRVTCDDMFFAREVVKAGGGIGALPAFVAAADARAGLLVRVLPRWVVHLGPVYLVQPGRRLQPRKVTAFRDIAAELLRERLG